MAEVVKVSPSVYLDHRRPEWARHEVREAIRVARLSRDTGVLYVIIDRWEAREVAEALREHWVTG